jgi:hypothetical protein
VAALERDAVDLLPKQLEAAWDALAEAVGDDVAEPILALLDDPSPLVCKLESHGSDAASRRSQRRTSASTTAR